MKANGPEKFTIHDGDQKVLVLDSKILRAVPDSTYIDPGDSGVSCFLSLPSGDDLPVRGSAQAASLLQFQTVEGSKAKGSRNH